MRPSDAKQPCCRSILYLKDNLDRHLAFHLGKALSRQRTYRFAIIDSAYGQHVVHPVPYYIRSRDVLTSGVFIGVATINLLTHLPSTDDASNQQIQATCQKQNTRPARLAPRSPCFMGQECNDKARYAKAEAYADCSIGHSQSTVQSVVRIVSKHAPPCSPVCVQVDVSSNPYRVAGEKPPPSWGQSSGASGRVYPFPHPCSSPTELYSRRGWGAAGHPLTPPPSSSQRLHLPLCKAYN